MLPTPGYYSSVSDFRHQNSSGGATKASHRKNISQGEIGVGTDAAVHNSSGRDSAMQELQLQYCGQQHQLFSPTGIELSSRVAASQVPANIVKSQISPRGDNMNGTADGVRGVSNTILTMEFEESGNYLRSLLEKAILAESEQFLLQDKRYNVNIVE